jgi:hypothetical protein
MVAIPGTRNQEPTRVKLKSMMQIKKKLPSQCQLTPVMEIPFMLFVR